MTPYEDRMTATRLLLIHTGGTIGMVRSDEGFTPAPGVVEAEVTRQLDLGGGMPDIHIQELAPLIDSANATPDDWNRISGVIHRKHDEYDGFVVTHGTDTLAFSAAALTMALEGLEKPVVLTGSMLPLSEPENDGQRNLSDAFNAACSVQPGVWVQFAGRLLHGARIRKTHSHFFDAFAAEATDGPPRRAGTAGVTRHDFGSPDVAVLPVVPGGAGNVLLHAAKTCDGIVLRCFGSGTIPNNPRTEEALRIAVEREIPVLAVSQCPEGGIALGTYAAGAILTRHLAVDGHDMTVEAAYVKMVLALTRGGNVAELRKFLSEPLCGESNSAEA